MSKQHSITSGGAQTFSQASVIQTERFGMNDNDKCIPHRYNINTSKPINPYFLRLHSQLPTTSRLIISPLSNTEAPVRGRDSRSFPRRHFRHDSRVSAEGPRPPRRQSTTVGYGTVCLFLFFVGALLRD